MVFESVGLFFGWSAHGHLNYRSGCLRLCVLGFDSPLAAFAVGGLGRFPLGVWSGATGWLIFAPCLRIIGWTSADGAEARLREKDK